MSQLWAAIVCAVDRYRVALLGSLGVIAVVAVLFAVRAAGTAPDTVAAGVASAQPTTSADLITASQRPPAPEFQGLAGWLNSDPRTMTSLRGQVVLIDFWTYSCVNCVHTLPHLQSLQAKYGGAGLTIVGVHSPEFDFEKSQSNVSGAVKRLGVTWPVALDSRMATWNAWGNRYWPAEYLVDRDGRVAYYHYGEGDYDHTERAILALLGTAGTVAAAPGQAADPGRTPELYAGSERGSIDAAYGPRGTTVVYPDAAPPTSPGRIQIVGGWADGGQYIEARSRAWVRLRFHANDLFLVAEAADATSTLTVTATLDGMPVLDAKRGPDLNGSSLAVGRSDLFHVIKNAGTGTHVLELTVPAGFRLYTFTFE